MTIDKSKKGQALVEIIVSIFVIALILISLVSAMTFSLTNTQFAKNKAIATKYAQEAVEWLRGERDSGWDNFYNNRASLAGSKYCLTTVGIWPVTGTCGTTAYITGTFLKREIVLTRSGADKVLIDVNMSWSQGSRTSSINVGTFLTKWE